MESDLISWSSALNEAFRWIEGTIPWRPVSLHLRCTDKDAAPVAIPTANSVDFWCAMADYACKVQLQFSPTGLMINQTFFKGDVCDFFYGKILFPVEF